MSRIQARFGARLRSRGTGSAVELPPRCLDVAEELLRPVAHSVDCGSKPDTGFGERVLDARRNGCVYVSVDQTVALQHSKILGQHLVTDSLDAISDLAEAKGAVGDRLDDEKSPLVGDVGEYLSRQGVRARHVGVLGRPHELRSHSLVPQSLESAFFPSDPTVSYGV